MALFDGVTTERASRANHAERALPAVRKQQMMLFKWPKSLSDSLEMRMLRRTAELMMAVIMFQVSA
jgi:hypothetical protein